MEKIRGARQSRDSERGKGQCRPVMFVRIILVGSVLPELSEFDRIDRLVIVHRPLIQSSTAEGDRKCGDQHQSDYEGTRHPEAATLKPQTSIFKLRGNAKLECDQPKIPQPRSVG